MRLLGSPPPWGGETCPKLGIGDVDAAVMREVGKRLAAVTRAFVPKAEVLDIATLSSGRDACSSLTWVNGAFPAEGAVFHPTLAGASATAAAVRSVVQSDR